MQYRKKPIVIDAVRWRGYSSNLGVTAEAPDQPADITADNMHGIKWEELPDWLPKPLPSAKDDIDAAMKAQPGKIVRFGETLLIGTLEGVMRCDEGDWLIRGVKGEIYPCKPDVFAATYESVA